MKTKSEMRHCHNCNKQHTESSAFCSQFCFDKWYDSINIPLMAVELVLQSMKSESKSENESNPKTKVN